MKILIADKFPESGVAELSRDGLELTYDPELKEASLAEAVKTTGADVLVVRGTKVTGEMLEAGRLSLVVRAGAGYNTIDVKTASARGIYVSNCPGKNSIAVAELAFGLILALDRRIAAGVADLKEGRWNKKEYSKARGLFGRTLGLIGLGRIGQEMISRARAFGMPVVAWSRSLSPERAEELGVEMKQSPAEVAASSDILSLHVALKDETRNLIDQKVFEAMRPGSFFINTSRAEVVDQAALERAARERGISAGLDVFAGEPSGGTGTVDNEIFKLDNVIGTHHIGASTDQAQQAIADETVRIIREYKRTGRPPNVVNLVKKSPATHLLVVRHFDRVGVLASVFDKLKQAGINVQETENIVFEGAVAAVARIHLDQVPPDATLEAIRSNSQDIVELSLLKL
ncbi:MAG TPA: 3-phosphoglycerate dehydrogenase family protein [Blastocatellia bacterium]|jgi:D-3-phosphoglycerate dehydrogenase|nr:3-phosphoglycerate dehydrogenase family protein [Blastocatellia bacterium]